MQGPWLPSQLRSKWQCPLREEAHPGRRLQWGGFCGGRGYCGGFCGWIRCHEPRRRGESRRCCGPRFRQRRRGSSPRMGSGHLSGLWLGGPIGSFRGSCGSCGRKHGARRLTYSMAPCKAVQNCTAMQCTSTSEPCLPVCLTLSACLSMGRSFLSRLATGPPVHLPTCLSICSSVRASCPSVHLPTCPSVRLSVCPSVHLCICASVHLPTCPPVHLPTCPPVHLCTCPPVHLSICPPVHLPTCPPVHLSTCPPVHLSTCPSVHLYLSICLSVHVSVCPSVHVFIDPSIRLSICPSVRLSTCAVRLPICLVCPSVSCAHLSVCPPAHLSVCPPAHLSVCPPVLHLFVYPSVHPYVCPPAHLSVCPPICLLICPCVLSVCASVHLMSVHLFT
jgi:hypothetical protein